MTAPRRNPMVAARRLSPQETVLLHLETGAYHGLNAEGALLWDMLDGTRTVADIIDELNTTVEPTADLHEFVTTFVMDLKERDLVR